MGKMTLYEVKRYYGESYKKILDSLMILVENFMFDVDKTNGELLSVECENEKGAYLKICHGMPDKSLYEVCYRKNRTDEMKNMQFRSQAKVSEHILREFWSYS